MLLVTLSPDIILAVLLKLAAEQLLSGVPSPHVDGEIPLKHELDLAARVGAVYPGLIVVHITVTVPTPSHVRRKV